MANSEVTLNLATRPPLLENVSSLIGIPLQQRSMLRHGMMVRMGELMVLVRGSFQLILQAVPLVSFSVTLYLVQVT